MDLPTILIIDDEKEFLDFMRKGLEPAGYKVITAEDGDSGVTKAQVLKPDLIICDIKMPKKDGFVVLKEIRQDKELRLAPFIMLTAVNEFNKVKKAYEDDADLYVTKPVEFAKLLKQIPLLLNLQKYKRD